MQIFQLLDGEGLIICKSEGNITFLKVSSNNYLNCYANISNSGW